MKILSSKSTWSTLASNDPLFGPYQEIPNQPRLTHGETLSRHSKAGARFHTGREPPYHKVLSYLYFFVSHCKWKLFVIMPHHQEEGTPRFTGTKFSCCGKTERSFWKDKLLKNSGCQNSWSCCGGEKNSNGCSSVEQHLCCQVLTEIQIQMKKKTDFLGSLERRTT